MQLHLEWMPIYQLLALAADPPDLGELGVRLAGLDCPLTLTGRGEAKPWFVVWAVDAADQPWVQVEYTPGLTEAAANLPEGEPLAEVEAARHAARASYVLSIRDGSDEPWLLVGAALAVALALLDLRTGKVHDLHAQRVLEADELRAILSRRDLAIEDHITLHLVTDAEASRAWLHSHGMEKFGRSNLETFDLVVDRGRDAGKLLNELLLSSALRSRLLLGETIDLPAGSVTVRPADEVRPGILGVPFEDFSGHEGPYLTVVSAADHEDISEPVAGHFHRSLTDPDDAGEDREVTLELLPLVESHFQSHAASTEYEYFARIPLRVLRGRGTESIWVRITRWQQSRLLGTLATDSLLDAEAKVGLQVEFTTGDIEAILLSVMGKPVTGRTLKRLLES